MACCPTGPEEVGETPMQPPASIIPWEWEEGNSWALEDRWGDTFGTGQGVG